MQEAHSNKYPNDFDDQIDLLEIFYALIERKWTIVGVTSFVSIIGVIYSLSLPNIYESKALIEPVNPSSGISGALQSYSGIAGLAGINLPPSTSESNTNAAIEKIGSLSFFEDNILPNIFLPDLMAVDSWNNRTDDLIYDDSIYNPITNQWVRKYSYPQKQIPTAQESFKVFKNDHFSISIDSKTNFITLRIRHQSPLIAQKWVSLLIDEVNAYFRQKDKLESERAIIFLNEQIITTNLSELQLLIAELLQEETQKLALIEANEYYVFDYIDPPSIMEEKSEPQRAIICILFMLFGMMLSFGFVLYKFYSSRELIFSKD
tara:strand:- start:1060 stop:2016 length:957 start_codon:yes stop_codon:yes gene_type:complete